MSALYAEDGVDHSSVKPFAVGLTSWMDNLPPDRRARIQQVRAGYDPEEEERKRRALDAEHALEQEAERQAYRVAGYLNRRPEEYTESSYARLIPQQNPKNKIRGWLESDAKTLLLLGPSGHGKTDAAYAIGNEAAARGIWVDTWYAPHLHSQLRPLEPHERYDANLTAARARAMRDLRDCQIFHFDDLGREDSGGWGVERWRATLVEIFNHRTSTPGLRNIITANVTSKETAVTELTERYGAPIVTRISQHCVPAWIEGTPLRRFAIWEPDF